MKNISLIVPFILLNLAVFAQQNEVWQLNGSDVSTTIQSNAASALVDFPVINMNWKYPIEEQESSNDAYRYYRFINSGSLYLKYSSDEQSYSNIAKFSGSMIDFYSSFTSNGHNSFFGNAKFYDKVLLENTTLSIGTSISDLTLSGGYKMQVKGNARFVNETHHLRSIRISGDDGNALEFGWGLDKHNDAGKIGYQLYSDGLDIIGAAEEWPNRKIRLWDKVLIGENGADVNGTHADYTLAVNGKIVSRSVVCRTDNWADYVFMQDYRLMPLKEVEAFIDKNGHLPNIPSEEEVVKNGVDLAEMNKLLLEKVEELTLHLIRLEKQINKSYE